MPSIRSVPAVLALSALVLFSPGCGGRPAPVTREAGHEAWAYTGSRAPSRWASLSPANAACGGSSQSPLDLHPVEPAGLAPVVVDYSPSPVRAVDTGHTIEWEVGDDSSAVVDGVQYRLRQFHFHAPAEHIVAGARHAVEFHFVHEADDGRRAVIAVLGREGRPHDGWAALLAAFPGRPVGNRPVALEPLLPPDRSAIHYDGSLTTPPCTEGVRWVVFQQPVEMADAQVAELRRRYHDNNRPTQPRNGRRLLTDDPAAAR